MKTDTEPDATPPVLRREDVDALLERLRPRLSEEDFAMIAAIVRSYVDVAGLLEQRRTTIDRLRRLIFGAASEKVRKVFDDVASEELATPPSEEPAEERPKAAGHGRRPASDYRGATRCRIPIADASAGSCCPSCPRGKLYGNVDPRVLVRVTGQAPLHATVYELEQLRCNLCGGVRTAAAPPGVGEEKYDAKAAAAIAMLKYGAGTPFHRLEGLQEDFGVPLPASTQWDIVDEAASELEPVLEELRRGAAASALLHLDDTDMTVLVKTPEAKGEPPEVPEGREGTRTSCILARSGEDEHDRAVYVTGPRHAGENLREVLTRRPEGAEPPIQMGDALSSNTPAGLMTIVANCLAHGRRQFVDAAPRFPAECRHVLDRLGEVYAVDAEAKERGLKPAERLVLHQTRSRPVMEALRNWMQAQFDERKTEPNSAFGQALSYLLKRWDRFTLFLRQAGAPLDNNICERALKLAVLHRKNAYFYRTRTGANVGDLFMSLIHTARLAKVPAFPYLTALLENTERVAAAPASWMPWNYHEALKPPG